MVPEAETLQQGTGGEIASPIFRRSESIGISSAPKIPSAAREFFPLNIGNRWHYSGRIEWNVAVNGVSASSSSFVFHYTEEREIIGIEELFGREYVLEEQKIIQDLHTDTVFYWIRYRQDHSGLYEADVSIIDPPNIINPANGLHPGSWLGKHGCKDSKWEIISEKVDDKYRTVFFQAWNRLQIRMQKLHNALAIGIRERKYVSRRPGGVLSDEITRLQYPLHPSAQWVIRDDPFFGSIVEALEVLELPMGRLPAFKIRIILEGIGPNDLVYLWYGRYGFLKMLIHLEAEVTDLEGNMLGSIFHHEFKLLD